MYEDISPEDLERVIQEAQTAFLLYRNCSLEKRALLMHAMADELQELGQTLLEHAHVETHLPYSRLENEKNRTIFQLRSYADACRRGDWMDIRIDTGQTGSGPDIRKMMVPLGPVAVFGAANFPFAYSTAGGDTACALAAGCPVIVKAHPAHSGTSEMVAEALQKAVGGQGLPSGLFSHIHGASNEIGKRLVEHPLVKAVGFTGSFAGGRQLFDWANQRKEPIPVFAEMSSTNPVFLLPEKLKQDPGSIALQLADSITQGMGQFCTNPGLIIAIKGPALDQFLQSLKGAIEKVTPEAMLHEGIQKNFIEKRFHALDQKEVEIQAVSKIPPAELEGLPTIASTTAQTFIGNPSLHGEVFGPFSLLIVCNDADEMLQVALSIDGQLTATLMASNDDINSHTALVDALKDRCGRFILNGVPTGVTVCLSMQHGGPYPSTTDSRFTAVGADGIKRFARPLAFQNWSDSLLPDELKNENPLGIWRTVNNEKTRSALIS